MSAILDQVLISLNLGLCFPKFYTQERPRGTGRRPRIANGPPSLFRWCSTGAQAPPTRSLALQPPWPTLLKFNFKFRVGPARVLPLCPHWKCTNSESGNCSLSVQAFSSKLALHLYTESLRRILNLFCFGIRVKTRNGPGGRHPTRTRSHDHQQIELLLFYCYTNYFLKR
jgi:hypothetical protein